MNGLKIPSVLYLKNILCWNIDPWRRFWTSMDCLCFISLLRFSSRDSHCALHMVLIDFTCTRVFSSLLCFSLGYVVILYYIILLAITANQVYDCVFIIKSLLHITLVSPLMTTSEATVHTEQNHGQCLEVLLLDFPAGFYAYMMFRIFILHTLFPKAYSWTYM